VLYGDGDRVCMQGSLIQGLSSQGRAQGLSSGSLKCQGLKVVFPKRSPANTLADVNDQQKTIELLTDRFELFAKFRPLYVHKVFAVCFRDFPAPEVEF